MHPNIETAKISRIGDRQSNQDRAEIVVAESSMLLILADGMGGHVRGGEAAEVAVNSIAEAFSSRRGKIEAAETFLRDALGSAHRAVVALGAEIDLEARPRTTCTVCLVTANRARWAHVGDSRIYLLREAGVQVRTRDHSTVEMLYREGMIERAEIATHPLRNYVEECLGGEPERPLIEVGEETVLEPGDIVLLCSDGFWAPLEASAWSAALWKTEDLQCELEALAAKAERESRPASDNVTAVAARWRTGAHDVSSNRP